MTAAAATVGRRSLRCAIYTRKSSEEGLDQEYNSLDAQRDAGHAYIASQKHEGTLVLSLPIEVRRRSSQKRIIGGDAAAGVAVPPVVLTPFQLALVRGHRWLGMLESGAATSLMEIAKAEGVDRSLVSRLLNLTTLSPGLVGTILDDRVSNSCTLLDVAIGPELVWHLG